MLATDAGAVRLSLDGDGSTSDLQAEQPRPWPFEGGASAGGAYVLPDGRTMLVWPEPALSGELLLWDTRKALSSAVKLPCVHAQDTERVCIRPHATKRAFTVAYSGREAASLCAYACDSVRRGRHA